MSKKQFLLDFMDEIWNKQLFDKVDKYVHPIYTVHLDAADPWEGKELDHSTFKERLKFSFDSFPDMHFEVTSAIPEDNHVAITWVLTGTNLGMIGGYPATGKSIKSNGITIYHFTDDLISGHTQVFDRMKVMQQLGFG
ncbi:MAG: ester cyclase [Saprospiraceae bacterium]